MFEATGLAMALGCACDLMVFLLSLGTLSRGLPAAPRHSDWLNEEDDLEDAKPGIPLAGHSGRPTKASARGPRSTAPISELPLLSPLHLWQPG